MGEYFTLTHWLNTATVILGIGPCLLFIIFKLISALDRYTLKRKSTNE